MSRYNVNTNRSNICSVYIADGFADDCDELIHRCTQVNTLSYEKFCDIWKEMEFACIFHGRSLSSELAELSEEVLHIAKRYMVANTDNYEESVAGLFLIYGLLKLQPISQFASLRLTPEDVPAIIRIRTVAQQTRRLDVLYILGSVLIRDTHYHAVERERGMEYPIRKYLEGYTSIDNRGIRPKGVFYRQNEELDIIRDLNRLGKMYKKAKQNVVGPGHTERNLNYVNENLPSELDTSLKNVINGIIETKNSESPSGAVEPSRVQGIKEKAMKMPVKGIAHLTTVTETVPRGRKRKPEKQTKRKGQARRGPKRKKRRVSTESETTTDEELVVSRDLELDVSDEAEAEEIDTRVEETTTRPDTDTVWEIEIIDEYKDKEKSPLISTMVKQMKLPDLSDTVGTVSEIDTVDKEPGTRPDSNTVWEVEIMDKEKSPLKPKMVRQMKLPNVSDTLSTNPEIDTGNEETGTHADIDTVWEIEIVDKDKSPPISTMVKQTKLADVGDTLNTNPENVDEKDASSTYFTRKNAKSKNIKGKDIASENVTKIKDALRKCNVGITDVGNSSRCETTVATFPKMDLKPPLKKSTRLRQVREKRDLKKPQIKTKFKRMGMLPVANFDDSTDHKK